jgi:divalent metal cation (Fe/Co/Zn/Cd) transporter
MDPGPEWHAASRRARALSWVSLAWMTGEGVLGLVAGLTAASLSLIGWALGSVIEGIASIIVIWRFTGSRTLSETAEGGAQKAVAVSFFLLAPYLATQAAHDLLTGHSSESSTLGVIVTSASLLVMPALGVTKQRLAAVLDSGSTAGEGLQNLMCAAQAGAVLAGLAATAAFGWTWVDPVIALVLAGWAVRAGRDSWRGEDCC